MTPPANDPYRDFLAAKAAVAPADGFGVDPREINPALKDFVRQAIVPWAAAGGRRAIFSSFGLHKTSTQLELARLALKRGRGPALIVLPLGVRHEFAEEAAARFAGDYAVRLNFIRRSEQLDPGAVNLTNYESVRDGKIDPHAFGFASLDEAAVLRGFGGTKTFREFMRRFAEGPGVPLRYVATATPDPNEFIELLAYAAFLGIMDVGEAKTRFFKRDSEHADKLTIHPHKAREFWLWVASWALFVRRPSDLGFSDDGYALPELDVRWHEVASDHKSAGAERDGQGRLFRNAAIGVADAAREKRDSLAARIAKLQQIRAEGPAGAHRIIWHDLEAERLAIERAVPGVRSIYGAQALDDNERLAVDFKHGRFAELAAKPVMCGAGCNFQAYCHHAVFLGVGHKFHDFIQAVHRLARFGQTRRVRLDLIYTDAEREIRRSLEAKWRRHEEQAREMAAIIRDYGLAEVALASAMRRSLGVARQEASGAGWRAVHNDCVDETRAMPADGVGLIVTSIPFATQYEYTPSYNDFGHTDDNAHFWRQMDFLSPELLRVLQPGRVMAVHVKDRIVPGGMTGLGFQTLAPFHASAIFHYQAHGFAFLGMKTVTTDVVRENNQTYRLGWSEQCKDGSRMGCGVPEYILLFRKPPSDRSNGYADLPVAKAKPLATGDDGVVRPFDEETNWRRPVPGTGYSRARWQLDAHGYARSSGDRLVSSAEVAALIGGRVKRDYLHQTLYRLWRERSHGTVYDFAGHVRLGEELDEAEVLPSTFMLLPPHSNHPDVWSDIARMRTMNMLQARTGREMHLCPLQFDIVERLIGQFSMPGETVFDPFGGLMTVPYCAVRLGRQGIGVELAEDYWRDGVDYLRAAERDQAVPTMFDLLGLAAA